MLVAQREPIAQKSIVGVDNRLDAIHLSQHMAALTHHQDLIFLQLDLLSPQFVEEVGTFDTVTAIHLLEHLPQAQLPLAFQHLLQVTRHRLMIAVPYETEATRAYGHEHVFRRNTLEYWGQWCVEALDGCAGYLRHPFKKRERANLRSINSREDPHTTKETDDILSLYERRKTEEKDKKTPVS